MGCLIDMKQKGDVLVGYCVGHAIFAFALTFDLDLRLFKVKFEVAVSQELLYD